MQNVIENQGNLNEKDTTKLEKIEKSIEKKSSQRTELLKQKIQGRFIIRTPHSEIAKFLNTTEGNISVQMMRSIRHLQKTNTAC